MEMMFLSFCSGHPSTDSLSFRRPRVDMKFTLFLVNELNWDPCDGTQRKTGIGEGREGH